MWRSLVDVEFDKLGMEWSGVGNRRERFARTLIMGCGKSPEVETTVFSDRQNRLIDRQHVVGDRPVKRA